VPTATISPRRSFAAALLAGLLHGPAETLPISSSAHVAFVARLAAGRRGRRPADPEAAKSLEVSAHAGTLAGLAVGLRHEAWTVTRGVIDDPRTAARAVGGIVIASLPAVAAAFGLERQIEDRLGGDATIALGLVAGSAAMVLADRRGDAEPRRRWPDATVGDAVAIGLVQTAALWPGVSRSGAVLTAARARGFARADAGRISAALAVPAVGGATLLKAWRMLRRLRAGTIDSRQLTPLVVVTVTSAASGLAAAPVARRTLDGLPLWPFAVYRAGLAATLTVADRRWSAPRAFCDDEQR
jgi:undecaprenyl-diphosphatase